MKIGHGTMKAILVVTVSLTPVMRINRISKMIWIVKKLLIAMVTTQTSKIHTVTKMCSTSMLSGR